MALVAKAFSNKLKVFITTLNETKQEDKDTSIDQFCTELESDVYAAIRSLTLIIPPGSIQVTGANSGGPVQSFNIAPITLNQVVK